MEAVPAVIQTPCDQVRADEGPWGAGIGSDYQRFVCHKDAGSGEKITLLCWMKDCKTYEQQME